MRAKPYITGSACRRVLRSAICKSLLLAARKRVHVLFQRELVFHLILCQLVLDVLCNGLIVLPCRIHVIPTAPKRAIAILILQVGMALKYEQGAFPFQKSPDTLVLCGIFTSIYRLSAFHMLSFSGTSAQTRCDICNSMLCALNYPCHLASCQCPPFVMLSCSWQTAASISKGVFFYMDRLSFFEPPA